MHSNDIYLTRVTLLGDIKDNNEDAWREFCVFYWDLITGWARNLGCSDAMSKDVFQESIVSLMRQMPNFDYDQNKGRFRSFIKTIVKRRVYDIYRKEGKYVNVSSMKGDDGDCSDDNFIDKINSKNDKSHSSENDMDLVWIDTVLKEAIRTTSQKVDPKTYMSFKLYVLEQRPVEDVLKVTGIEKVGTVYQHKSRFLSALKSEFYELLNDTKETEDYKFDGYGEKVFNQALSNVVEGRIDLKTTMTGNILPEEMVLRLGAIRDVISELEFDKESASNSAVFITEGKKEAYNIDDKIQVGRSDKADIIVDDKDVSYVHLTLTRDGSTVYAKDEQSTNGTYINGRKIDNKSKVIPGDIIIIGAKSAFIIV